jgi:putative glutamine amidotransferase
MSAPDSMRPTIGLTSASVVIGDRLTDITQREYSAAVVAAGGLPRILPSISALSADEVRCGLDGLVLTGGGDVDPLRYGEERKPETAAVDDERDAFEVALVRLAVLDGLAVLGICRGCQVMNVALGGSLIQHLPAVTSERHLVVEDRSSVAHRVTIAQGSVLDGIVHERSIGVNSVHHQGLARVATMLQPVGWSDDRLVEAIEHPNLPLVGVQWHPESMQGQPEQRRLFEWLVEHARSASGEASHT